MSFFGDIFAGKAEKKASEYNAKIIENNKKIKEQEAVQIMSVHNNFTLPKFDKTVEQIQGETRVAYLSSGAALEGTVLDTLYAQALELETDRDILTFNAENAKATKENEAIMMQADADLQRWRG